MLLNDGWLCLFVGARLPADLHAIIDNGWGDVPVKDLKFRCMSCSSALTVVMLWPCNRGVAITDTGAATVRQID